VETHYDNDRFDLMIHPQQLARFPELQAYCDSFPDLAALDGPDQSHVPYIVILQRLAAQWIKQHGKLPASYQDQQAFKRVRGGPFRAVCVVRERRPPTPVSLLKRQSSPARLPCTRVLAMTRAACAQSIIAAARDFGKQGNFQEAEQFAYRALSVPSVSRQRAPRARRCTARWAVTLAVRAA
jgi:hypothetical protein